MGLLSIFQRKKQTAAKPAKSRARAPARQAPAPSPADAAEAFRDARARARRRLMGATVLLLVGVIGFPLLFETQPRPIPVDLPIEIPARNGGAAIDAPSPAAARTHGPSPAARVLAVANPPATGASTSTDAVPGTATAASAASSTGQGSARPSLATALSPTALHGSEAAAASAAAASGVQSAAYLKPKPTRPTKADAPAASKPVPIPPAQPTLPPPTSTAGAGSGDVAAALLAGKPAPATSDAAPDGGRFVVQIGAFADDGKMHDARGKVEKLGFKSYTQAVDTPSGKRVRVRVGPYTTKAEADRAAAKIKADGLPAAVLAL